MKTEKGVIIAAYKQDRHPRFVILNRKKNWEGWELPKGHLEDDDYEETVRIELQEEAGIDEEQIEEIEELDYVAEWTYEESGEEIKREYRGFVIRLSEDALIDVKSNPHDEHSQGFFFRQEDAESLLAYENNIGVLNEAVDQIED
jgi:8-oxo-dGTP pyrophosphatase MutT (NUDIX family)